MILDDGVLTVFEKRNMALSGYMPQFEYIPVYKSWYKRLSYSTLPRYLLEQREYSQVSLKVRVLRSERITNHAVVVLRDAGKISPDDTQYEVIRAFHGDDPDAADPITDIDLEVIQP